jgi:hypothetical protein
VGRGAAGYWDNWSYHLDVYQSWKLTKEAPLLLREHLPVSSFFFPTVRRDAESLSLPGLDSKTTARFSVAFLTTPFSLTLVHDYYVVELMQLRDHPLMSCHGASNWPPVWTQANLSVEKPKIIRDEVGILVYIRGYEGASTKCYLVIEYEGEHYVGVLLFEDMAFCRRITDLLEQHIGRSIEEIGDLDIGETL